MNTKTAEKVAEILLEIKAITLRPNKPYTFASGILSPIYTDCRLLMSYPKQRNQIIDWYIEAIKSTGEKFDVIAGTATAGIPHAAWIAQRLELPMVYVRGKAKDHGKENLIEGIVHEKQYVAVIEDLISSGGSSVNAVQAIRSAGGIASHVFAIFTYSHQKTQENIRRSKITLTVLTDIQTLVLVAGKCGILKKDEQQLVLDWVSDPASWGKT